MGVGQSKRSVDITAPPKDGVQEVAGDEKIPVEGKLEKIEDTVKPATNGSSHSEPETKAVEEVVANGGDLKDKIVADAEPETLTSPDIEPASPENETPEADTNNKSKKALKVKKKWSFRSMSFSKKDKKKPNKEEGSATKDGTGAATELIEEKPEGAAGFLASVTGAVTGAVNDTVETVTKQAEEEVAAAQTKVEEVLTAVTEKADEVVAAIKDKVEVVAASVAEKISGAKEVVAEADSAKTAALEAFKEELNAVDSKVDEVKAQAVAATSEIENAATEVCDLASSEISAATTEIISKTEELVTKVEEIPPPLPACPPPNDIIASMVSQAVERVTVENTEEPADKARIQVPCIKVQPASPIPATAVFEEVSKVAEDFVESGEKVTEQVEQKVDEVCVKFESLATQCVESVEEKSPIIEIAETLAETQVSKLSNLDNAQAVNVA